MWNLLVALVVIKFYTYTKYVNTAVGEVKNRISERINMAC